MDGSGTTPSQEQRGQFDGTYVYPSDFDQATKEICKECAKIWAMIPQNSLDTLLTKEDWQCQWQGRRELTSSLE